MYESAPNYITAQFLCSSSLPSVNPPVLRSSENEYNLQLRNEIVPFWIVWSHSGVYSVFKEPSSFLEVTEGLLLSICETTRYCNLQGMDKIVEALDSIGIKLFVLAALEEY